MIIDYYKSNIKKIDVPLNRIGLSATYRPGTKTIYKAIDEGLNTYFFFGFDTQMIKIIKELPNNVRNKIVMVTGAYNYMLFNQNIRKTCEKRLKQLKTDYIDLFLFLGVIKEKELTPNIIEDLNKLKEEGKVKAIGISTHNRKFAAKLMVKNVLDVLMIRYNAVHRNAEIDIFPSKNENSGIIAYTATCWRRLLGKPKDWKENRIPTAGECYRFVLNNPLVDVCLMAPRSILELEENLVEIRKGPLFDEDIFFLQRFGDHIHAQKKWFM